MSEKILPSEKTSQCQKNFSGGPFGIFQQTSILTQNSKKIEGGPLGKFFFLEKKSRSAEKNERTVWRRPV